MPYEYDIFISYKRGPEAERWIQRHFEPLLEHAVGLELGRDPVIFRDNEIDDGATWPLSLAAALGKSRVLVPLWSKLYFNSEWCTRELGAMLNRERALGCRQPGNPSGLVIPSVIHDCQNVGQEYPLVSGIQLRRIHGCYNVRMNEDSPQSVRLAEELSEAARGIASAIENAPEWQPDWVNDLGEQFLADLYRNQPPRQRQVPGVAAP